MKNIKINWQAISELEPLADEAAARTWVEHALVDCEGDVELTLRFVDIEESRDLNYRYRSKNGPTNVLSFPDEAPKELRGDALGDLIICVPVVVREAQAQAKSLTAHFAHLIVHGCLHLQGYDHIEDEQATVMEAKEVAIMSTLGFPNPYTKLSAEGNPYE